MEKLLENVKVELGITINDELIDKNITLKINAVKGYLENGGAKIDINNISGETLSCIAIGVNDLLNNKAGETKFSPAFNMLAMQICRR
ncbi:hypothetical protein CSBG_01050 [Clostridium sp. 7_2_43FAA]|uniref:hypothetical protein n=1 Tax=Clostridium TaxID=1485 RepID=UPI00019AFFE3|nr:MULTISPECIES: hypothetical protein [Clostridium]EEH97424.1 hypothetical protein CSBG_01050 [Clostridium sp. 7_2_43FAA]